MLVNRPAQKGKTMGNRMTTEEYRQALKVHFNDNHAKASRLLGFSRAMSYMYYNGDSKIPNAVRNLIFIADEIGARKLEEIIATGEKSKGVA